MQKLKILIWNNIVPLRVNISIIIDLYIFLFPKRKPIISILRFSWWITEFLIFRFCFGNCWVNLIFLDIFLKNLLFTIFLFEVINLLSSNSIFYEIKILVINATFITAILFMLSALSSYFFLLSYLITTLQNICWTAKSVIIFTF